MKTRRIISVCMLALVLVGFCQVRRVVAFFAKSVSLVTRGVQHD
jgi:hypothetical protein